MQEWSRGCVTGRAPFNAERLRGQAYRMSPAQVTWTTYCESGTMLSVCHVFYCLLLITTPYSRYGHYLLLIHETEAQRRNLLKVTKDHTQVCDTLGYLLSPPQIRFFLTMNSAYQLVHKPWY